VRLNSSAELKTIEFGKTIVTSNLTAGCPQREKPPVCGSKNWMRKTEFELPRGDE
jgi:hypothetical protein